MALKSYEGLAAHVLAAQKQAKTEASRRFFHTLERAFRHRGVTGGRKPNRQALATGLAEAVRGLLDSIASESGATVTQPRIAIDPLLGISKFADYSIEKKGRRFLIEQKSILRGNEFGQIFYEGVLTKKFEPKTRFAALFHYHHQNPDLFKSFHAFGTRIVIDHQYVLIPGPYERGYDPRVVDRLRSDILKCLA
jgi:hypothetical protein